MAFKTVAVAGASGNVGTATVNALLAKGFTVSALTRDGSKASFPEGVKVVTIDYSSEDTMAEAFKGQDVVIVALGPHASGYHVSLVHAAVKAGVKRIFPCEWGGDLDLPINRAFPVFASKVQAQDLLKELAQQGKITYTLVENGLFLDWVFETDIGILFDYKKGIAHFLDDGKNTISASTTSTIGKAVAASLERPEQTENRTIYIQDGETSQAKLLELIKKYAPQIEWTVQNEETEELVKSTNEALKQPGANPFVGMRHIMATIFGNEKYGQPWGKKNSMASLGLKELSDEEFEAVVKESIQKGVAKSSA
jgi:uncharacterized protein YbjT (DUF2867 family)